MQQQNTPNPTYHAPSAHPPNRFPTEAARRRGHHWLMWLSACPLLLVGALIATGRLGAGGLLALGCLLAMAR